MQKIETGSAHIHRFDGALAAGLCERLCALSFDHSAKPEGSVDAGALPWFDSDTLAYDLWKDEQLRQQVGAYRIMLCQLIAACFSQIVYPHFTDLVRWRPGKQMAEHKDDGYEGDHELMKFRHFSAVTYCNDDYEGGETFIKTEHGTYYQSVPKRGSVVFYPSDERATHGVNAVHGRDRVTLSTWFTRDWRHYRP